MFKSFKEQKELKKKSEGKVVELPNEEEVLEVSTEPIDTKIEKEDKNSFEEFKVLYKGQIDDKCLEDYGTIEDEKLWEDTAKELFMASEDYIPEEDDKAEKIEEAKKLTEAIFRVEYTAEITNPEEIKEDIKGWLKDLADEVSIKVIPGDKTTYTYVELEGDKDKIINHLIQSGHCDGMTPEEVCDSYLIKEGKLEKERYQVREFEGPGAKFGVFDTKEKKFVQKGSKYVMDAACKDLNEKGKVTESSLIKNTLKEMLNKKTENEEDELLRGKDVLYVFEDFDTGIDKDQKNLIKFANDELKLNLDPDKDDLKIALEIQKLPGKQVEKLIRMCYGDEIADKFEIFLDNSLETLDTSKIKYIKESIEEGSAIFELKFDCSNEDNFGIGDSMATPLVNVLTDVVDKVASGRFDGPIMDINGNKIGSYGIGYEGVETGLSESKKIEESVRDDLVLLREENKGLYDYVANNYYKMSTEELKEIALDAIYVADKDFEIIDEYLDRVEESVDDDIEKAKKDSKEKGLYCETEDINDIVEQEVTVTDGDKDINSVMIVYVSNQTFMKYYNLQKPLTIEELKSIKLKIKNHEMYVTDIKDKLNATEVDSKKELIPNTYIMKIKENDVEDLEEVKEVPEHTDGYDAVDYFWEDEDIKAIQELVGGAAEVKVGSEKNILQIEAPRTKYINGGIINGSDELVKAIIELVHKQHPNVKITCGGNGTTFILRDTVTWKSKDNKEENLEEANPDSAAQSLLQDLKDLDKLSESQVSEYTFKELNKVINDKGNDFKIQIAGSEDKTNWLNIDKEDLQVIYQALQSRKAK